jgi:cinnamyl-alcohol dehydrogenase
MPAPARAPTHPAADGEGNCLGFAAKDAGGVLVPWKFSRRALGARDVRMAVSFCGICHSDLHQIRNEWGNSSFPMCPGHEITGVVTEVGPEVTAFAVGDHAGVGCMVNACKACKQCDAGREQYCTKCIFTYSSKDVDGSATQGGYSTALVVDEAFALKMPATLPLDAGAPLLCAGITVWSPMRHYGLDKPGQRIGVVGLGGLGHMAVKFALAFGAHVTVISTSEGKREEACTRLGANAFIVSKNGEEVRALPCPALPCPALPCLLLRSRWLNLRRCPPRRRWPPPRAPWTASSTPCPPSTTSTRTQACSASTASSWWWASRPSPSPCPTARSSSSASPWEGR